MEEDTEFKKLPVEERCVHKLWKARVDGYEEAIKIFREIDDEKSTEWNKFINIIKKMVVDSNAMAQEKGLEATLLFVENCANASKTCSEVVPGIIGKCIAAPKAKTRDISVQIILMYIEIEKQEIVIEEMIKGLDHKNPRIVAACIAAITLALHEFGHKVIGVKPIIKKISQLLSDRDKGVRDEGKRLTVEIYRWIGAALQSQLTALPAVLLTELDTEFVKVKGEKPEPTRYLKSQQVKRKIVEAAAAAAAANGDDNGGGPDDLIGQDDEIDPMDLIEPVDILSQLPKDFYEKLEAKKWQERKESLEALEVLLQNPKLESGDYGDVVRALKKVLTKDTNVLLVALAGKCMALLAKGLAKRYSPYANVCVPAILEKFKEKKLNVVTALREAIDAILPSTSLEAIQEDLLEALNNKNPNIKAETASFFARSFTKTVPTLINKKLLKLFTGALIKTLNESDPTVRDASADALGTLLKLMGEKIVGPFLTDVDPLKMAKIKECSEKAVIIVKIPTNKKDRPATAPPVKSATAIRGGGGAGSTESKTTTRPTTATIGKKPIVKKTMASGGGGGGGGGFAGGISKSGSSAKILPSERDMSNEEIDEKAIEILPPDIINGLCDANWKTRVTAAESFIGAIDTIENSSGLSQILLRSVCKKPGFKDMNFQVVKVKLDIVKKVIDLFSVTTTTAEYLINDITEKLGDAKNSIGAANALTAIAETISLEFVVGKIINFSFEQQKSPKVQSEALNWVASAIKEFGFVINPKILLDDIKKAVQSTNPTVRQSAITLLGVMHLYMGNSLSMYFDNEKAALKQQIQTEFDKNSDQKAPAPIRGKIGGNKMMDNDEMADPDDNNHQQQQQQMINLCDSLPRIDISGQITESLLNEISDKNWKVKIEGLTKLQAILSEAKLIKPTIGDLPQTLALRLVDSNAKIAQTTLTICQQLAESMGTNCKQHVRVLFPGFLQDLGDGKPYIRAASIQCMNVWGDQCGYKEFFEGEMIADALKSGSPALRIELWAWLAEKLQVITPKTIMKEELTACLPYLFVNICDRNADVRKNANEAILGYMIHLGYDNMMKSLERLKSPSKKDIQAALDKVRPNLPVKPLPKSKQQAPIPEEIKKTIGGKNMKTNATSNGIGGGGAGGNSGNAPNSGGGGGGLKGAAPTSRKKDEEIDTSPLLSVNNTKNQRLIDEQKLKVLKWTFTQPREEFTDLLRDQMTTANINKSLMANMFHDDFRYHLKAIDSLNEDLNGMNGKALICNLDLILKWISLRFYDTNPSVLLKGLDYLNLVFQMLIDTEYVLAENEGSCFIPHLLIKIGDPKDTVRNGVRALFRQICLIYPYTKVFAYIMEGLKSKNARQRTECLDELGYLIETYGLNVCQPTPQIALKEIARHISDRDNSVRSAALNCVVQAYFLTGEKVYKLIGNLNEKDLSMLDERIKRATKNRTKKVDAKPNVVGGGIIRSETIDTEDDIMIEDVPQQHNNNHHHSMEEPNNVSSSSDHTPPPPTSTMLLTKPKVNGPFGLNSNVLADIEMGWIRSEQMPATEIISVDLSVLNTPLKIVEKNGVGYPTDQLQRLISMQPSMMPQHPNYTMSPPQPISALYSSKSTNINVADALPKLDPNLVRIIRSIGNTDTITARAALNELNDILESPEKQAVLRDYEDLYVESIYCQIKNFSQIPINESLIMYQPVLSSTYDFFTSKSLGKNVSVDSLKKLMSSLLGLMADHKLANNDEARYTKVINTICLRILDRTNFTNLNCALIRLLKETCSCAGLPKFTDLIMKCIWRNVKVMPEKSNELDYDAVLLEAHDFMVTLPSAWWAQRPSDTPSRTVRTIVHNMVKIKGNSILQHTSKIPQHSELRALLIRVLKNMQKDMQTTATTTTTGPTATTNALTGNVTSGFTGGGTFNIRKPLIMPQTSSSSSKYLSNQIHEAMSHILSLISNKETAKEGLANLYELKTQHPDLDISQFLKGANEFFLKFIDDGLAEIERSNNINNNHNNNNMNINIKIEENNNNNNNNNHIIHTSNDFKTKLEPDYWLNKLNSIRNPNAVVNIKEYNMNFEKDRMTTTTAHNRFYNPISQTSPTQQQQQVAVDPIPTNREVLLQKLAQIRMQKNS